MSTANFAEPAEFVGPASKRTFLGHPVGLYVLFFAEMWERFSYYGMRGLLKLYMVNYLFVTLREPLQGCKHADPACTLIAGDPSQVWLWGAMKSIVPENPAEAASLLYGLYTALVYLTPLFGGTLADRVLGQRKTVVIGGLLMAIGHFVMAFQNLFFVALFLLIIGNGAFKPNVSTQVGGLYPPGDPRRDGAFTIFYMGINLGSFICNLVCGTLAVVYGWHYGFAAAGVGMVIGLIFYIAGNSLLSPDNLSKTKVAADADKAAPKAAHPVDPKVRKIATGLYALVAASIVACIVDGYFTGWGLTLFIIILFCATSTFFINRLAHAHPALESKEWNAVLALVGLCVLNVVFWAVYEQQGNTMQSWADDKTIWPSIPLGILVVIGGALAFALIAAIAGLMLVIVDAIPSDKPRYFVGLVVGSSVLGGIGSLVWAITHGYALGSPFQIPSTYFQSFNPLCIIVFAPVMDVIWRWQSTKGKEPSSVSKMAIGCIILGLSFIVMIVGVKAVGDGRGSPFWPLFCTLLLTFGELYLSPIGLSLVTKVSPARIVSMMMGMWFLSSFVGNYASGAIGVLYTRWSNGAFFALLTVLGVGAGLAMWAFNKPLKKAIGADV